MLSKQYLTFGAFLATIVSASPISVPAPEQGLVAIQQTEFLNGTLTWYGEDPAFTRRSVNAASSKPLEKRCGSTLPQCSTVHQSYTSVCRTLIDNLPDVGIPNSPRSTCYNVGGVTCCISWGKVIDNARFPALRYAANKVMDVCVERRSNGEVLVSGQTKDTLVGGTCLYQCLSNRATNCDSS
ncbi:hypothetical protein B0T20DRAFT_217364 [Sordaria brevicollis]|uniref:WD-like domain-containing protein n=1 Tax=Sordaria brevicollis TaxID=83679 RepID=A0AAE0UC56_SORBR|nr:hypothetical protein B0T20DRAFT_217364 [Sordaria brevicollis]